MRWPEPSSYFILRKPSLGGTNLDCRALHPGGRPLRLHLLDIAYSLSFALAAYPRPYVSGICHHPFSTLIDTGIGSCPLVCRVHTPCPLGLPLRTRPLIGRSKQPVSSTGCSRSNRAGTRPFAVSHCKVVFHGDKAFIPGQRLAYLGDPRRGPEEHTKRM